MKKKYVKLIAILGIVFLPITIMIAFIAVICSGIFTIYNMLCDALEEFNEWIAEIRKRTEKP